MKKLDLSELTDQEILTAPIYKLASGRVRHFSSYLLSLLKPELRAKGINFTPKVWCSTDWFSPDGQAGFAYPFYLLDQRLKDIFLQYFYELEGSDESELLKLLRHECAHAIDNAYGLRKLKIRQKLFGITATPYPASYRPNKNKNNYIENLGESYGMSHPDEDWAETFAVWLSKEEPSSVSEVSNAKYAYVDEVAGKYLFKAAAKKKKINTIDNALELKMSFSEFIELRKSEYKKILKNPPDLGLSKNNLFNKVQQSEESTERAIIIARNLFNAGNSLSIQPGKPINFVMEKMTKKHGLDQVIM